MPTISQICTHPVKSLSGISIDSVTLSKDEGLPNDRRYAITNGISNTMNGDWLTCRSFFINSINDGLLKFKIEMDGETIRIKSPEGLGLSLRFNDPEGLAIANRRLADFVRSLNPDASMPAPVITERNQTNGALSGYWDFTDSAISIMNRASFEALAGAMGAELDIRRLRGNLIVDDLPAWEEFSWLGKRIRIGDAELEIFRPAQRCPATSVNPHTGERDLKVPDAMNEHFGHAFCGMYAKVVKSGNIKTDDKIEVIGNAETPLEEAALPAAPDYKLWPKMANISLHKPTDKGVEISITSSGSWPLPEAKSGQRVRFHIGKDLIGVATVSEQRDHTTVVHVEPSKTRDPATAYLLEKVKTGDRLIVSGPFGRG